MTKKKLLKALAIAAVTTSLVACSSGNTSSDESTSSASSGSSVATVDNNVKSDASYTIGYGMGASVSADKNIKAAGINNDKLVAGFEDAMSSTKPAIPLEDIATNMNNLRQSMQQKMSEERVSSFLKVKDSIYNSDLTPKSDVKDPSVVIYEFFDYQCMYCSKVAPEIEKIIENDPNVQVVFGEFPIFGERAPASEYAAEVGTAVYKLYGADAYVKYHNGIFATGEDEGKLKDSTVDKVAEQAGAKMDDVKKAIKDDKIADHLKATLKMGFEDLGIQGTPFLVVAPAKDADASNTTVIGGYTDSKGIQAAVDKAQGKSDADEQQATTDDSQASDAQAQENASATTDEAQAADANQEPQQANPDK
ncbi:DSBA-like thioredoxin domain-containing protein [Candidatus Francisella endociliophora]|uniref:DSBA-like thioredoxin domain-containing protein n=1 Tax=Candidatus Francisella endociliophora TaxID=653937 RepID=A0A097EMN7_9GAMM|nr:DsbA family protein [Francisella sp. FSC1006]AIT08834.1 DSBA-like thioredoxin domain-containing protein [Francisella sp. FSC1006]